MAQMHLGEPDFADMLLRTKPSRSTKFLEKLDEQVDWKPFKDILSSIYSSYRGRKSFPLITLFKSLLLQQWYDLSDYALEDAINDRLSFRAFVGISMSEDVPDHSVYSRFRSQLRDKGLMDDLFKELDRQLEIKGLVLKKGTLVDASVVQANVSPPSQTKEGKAGKSETDQDARWVCMGKKRSFGYKMHVGVDQESGIIRSHAFTPANTYEGHILPALVRGDEQWVFADKAYDSKENNNCLAEKKVGNGIMFHGHTHRKLTEMYRKCNRFISGIRSGVERIFGTLKRSYGYSRVRYVGLERNHQQFSFLCMAYNMRKMIS
jgi:transposase, IS5 family